MAVNTNTVRMKCTECGQIVQENSGLIGCCPEANAIYGTHTFEVVL